MRLITTMNLWPFVVRGVRWSGAQRRRTGLACCYGSPGRASIELTVGRRVGDDVVEADCPCWTAEFDEVEVPDRLRHRAPLFALGADIKRAVSSTRERRVVAGRPAGNSCAGEMRDPRVDEGADSIRDSEAIDQDDAVSLPEGERPGCTSGVELERAPGLEGG
jgi:hypothetical protein